ncbi:T9SS type A sorting domain-containing protein [Aquimarina sp. D1M17]|uniref:T9SS type A sorting domain-containing protein n=1 Tax=Aquimarina acroporae TaxID=2937283 RepID=UPI0020BD4A10|nr:T9SS type A sorting domain-containing protein [Aquimarina acroporae]MCK8522311.1 T9SS type A sorting domain-containing protein [Aquimarina acroporae]
MKLKTTLIALFSCALLFSQNFAEVQLPTPDKLSPLFIGPLVKSTIHYGVTPPNYNGKVIIFNHGYIDLNQGQFLFDNSFYQDTYNEGYQAIFVATTRGKGIWINGELLAEAIDIVTQKYNVAQVYLVGHSNGGKASEAAMFQFGKKDKVTRAFALGTPFWGTYLADISQMPWLNWAWRLTGLNEGARTSTTYYCRDVVRPILDNHPDNEPGKFVVLGASGFYKGSTIAAPAFLLTGGILLPVQGANDGVAPYNSTLRPGAEYVFSKNDSRAIFDHLDVGLGQFSWPYVKSYIENKNHKSIVSNINEKHPTRIESNYYIIHSENEYDKINLDKGSKFAVAEILHEDSEAIFNSIDKNGKKVIHKNYHTQNHKTVIPFSEDQVSLKSNSKFVAFIKQDNGIRMSLERISNKNNTILKVDIYSNQKDIQPIKNTEVRAILTKTSEIDGTPTQNESKVVLFKRNGSSFYYDTKNLEHGVYSAFINSENNTAFRRSIISGFVVGDIQEAFALNSNNGSLKPIKESIRIIPNSVKNNAVLSINTELASKHIKATIYDITGRSVKTISLDTADNAYDISEHVQSLIPGIYLLNVNHQSTIKFVKE